MGIFSRFQDIINANLNALLDQAEDPQKMIRMMIQEMEETLVEVRSSSAKVIADRKQLERRVDYLRREAGEWEDRATLALSRGREDLARAALSEQGELENTLNIVSEELRQVIGHIEELHSEVGQLQGKLDDAKAKQKALRARGESAQTRSAIRKRFSRDKLNAAFEQFERYERRLDDLESEVEAADLGGRDLAEEIAELERDEKIEAALAKLRDKVSAKSALSE